VKYNVISSFGFGNGQAIKTIKEISELNPIDNEIIFDFTGFVETNPFNILVIANSINALKAKNPNIKTKLIPNSNSTFLGHLGFYKTIGANLGKEIGEAKANNNYMPITKINFDEMQDGFYNSIEEKAQQLSALLNFDSDLSGFSKYIFIETIRNVYEHAETNNLLLCAQKWPTMDLVEIAIVDNGIGIANALKKRIKGKTEKELMYMAALPGISAKSNHAFLDKDDFWRNSGYGLYVLREFSKAYNGSFMLCSKNIALHQINGKVKECSTFFEGTAVAIRFRTNLEIDFNSTRRDIVRKAQKLAKNNPQAIKEASKSSGGNYIP